MRNECRTAEVSQATVVRGGAICVAPSRYADSIVRLTYVLGAIRLVPPKKGGEQNESSKE